MIIEKKISILDERYKNIEDSFRNQLIEELKSLDVCHKKNVIEFLKNKMDIHKKISVYTKEYWEKRGWPENIIQTKIREQRPLNYEYYMKRGFNKESAIEEVKKYQSIQGKKYIDKYSTEERRHKTPTCKEYWTDRGYSKNDAIKKVSERQSTFSLKSCVERYGKTDGYKRWKKRQNKWQKTMQDKTEDELDQINFKRGYSGVNQLKEKFGDDWREYYIDIHEKCGDKICYTIDELKKYIDNIICKPSLYIKVSEEDRLNMFDERHFDYLDINKPSYLTALFKTLNFNTEVVPIRGGYSYIAYTKDGKLLRSSGEIYFYNRMSNHIIEIGRRYENSNMKYDFLMTNGDYIEIAGMMNIEKYRQKMKFKEITFGSIILKNKTEMDEYENNYREYI